MTPKRQYETIKRRKKSPIGLIAIIAAVVCIVIAGACVALFLTSNAVSDVVDSSGVSLTCSVSGNDLIVTIYDTGRADDIEYITIAMEGYTIPPGYSVKSLPSGNYPKSIVYEDVATGISGNMQISFRATFKDGTSSIIWMDTVRFT
ncbi:MAG: hypothetical protein Q4Q53_07095 [Methanocorpusculum sp.]|nr:hypothetical protein [Methanocorpusculum sp.]